VAAHGRDIKALGVAILTVSDGVAAGRREDLAGELVAAEASRLGWRVAARAVLPDEAGAVAAWLSGQCDGPGAPDLVLTLGGTGLGPRDVTPEATLPLLDCLVPGLAEALRHEGSRHTLAAYLSRGVAGLRRRTLIVNVAGSAGAARDAMDLLGRLVPHALHVLGGGGHERQEGAVAERPAGAGAEPSDRAGKGQGSAGGHG
jgi:molybdopterin adenylyltransferase